MARIHYGVKNIEKIRGPKMAKIQYGVQPDIFKYANVCPSSLMETRISVTVGFCLVLL